VFPAILKPAISGPLNSFTISKAWPARDLKTLVARYDEACAVVDPSLIMIQEVIPVRESQFRMPRFARTVDLCFARRATHAPVADRFRPREHLRRDRGRRRWKRTRGSCWRRSDSAAS